MDEKIDDAIDSDTGLKFNPIDENTALPIVRQVHNIGMPVSPPEQVTGQPIGSGDAPYLFGGEVKLEAQPEKTPGFFGTAGHVIWEMALPVTAWNIGSTLYKDLTDHTEVPEGWSPYSQKEYFENTPEKYWRSLATATSPKRQEQIYQRILEEIKDDSYYSKGPFTGKLLGGLAGFYGSGANFIKVASAGRYSTMSETVLRNIEAAAPGLTAQSIEMAAVEQLGRAGTDAEEFGVEALQMLAVSGLLHVGGQYLKEGLHAKKLYDAKDAMHAQSEKVSFEPVLNEKGEVTGYEPVANAGHDVSAAELKAYKEFLDSRVNESGLMKSKTMQMFFGNRAFGSTLFRMKTSPFATSSQYLSTVLKNRFLTAGEVKGQASQFTATEYHQELQAQGYHLANRISELYFKTIGLGEKNTYTNKTKAAFMSKDPDVFISKKEFGQQVRDAIEGDKPSERTEVNEAAAEIRAFMHETNKSLGKAMGLNDVAFVTPKNYFDYFPHAFDHEAIKLDQVNAKVNADGTQSGSLFIDNMVAHLEEQDNKIMNLIRSHDSFNSLIQERQLKLLDHLKSKMRDDEFFQDRKLTGDATEHLEVKPDRAFKEETNALKHEIDSLKKSIADIEAEKKAWWDSVLEDPANNHLIVDGEYMTKEMRDLGSQWLSNYSKLETLVETLEKASKKEINAAKKAVGKAERDIYRQSTSEGRNKAQDVFREKRYAAEWLDAELNKALREAKDNLDVERARLDAAARDGSMPRILYRLTGDNNIEFINPNRAPELKQHFTSYKEREAFAMQKRDAIINNTEGQLKRDLFDSKDIANRDSTAFLKKRDRTIPYHVYNDGGFFSHDITETITSYADSVGKRLGMMQAFNDSGRFTSIEDVAAALKQEHADKLLNVAKIKDPVQKEKARKQLQKDYDIAKKDINGIHNAYMGADGSQAAKGFNRAFSMYANAAFMGGLPIAMVSDIGQQVMRHGIGNYMVTGLIPILKTLNGHFKTQNSMSMVDAAGDAGVAMNVLKARVHLNQMNVNGDSSAHMGGWFSRLASFSGNASGQITFANYIQDMMHTMTSSMAQSRVMRNMHNFVKEGKLDQRETEYMAALGIDPKVYAKRFVEQFKKYGRKDGKKGYHSEHTSWDDLEAYSMMRRGIYRDVMATHFEGNRFDSPRWSSNPFVKPFFTFQNWAFAAFNNISVPLLQGVDGRKAMGIATLIMLGMLQEPMRAFINNKEYKIPKPHQLATIGLLNSGILGQFSNMINLANTATGGVLAPGFLPQKYANISPTGAIAGVPGSIADAVVDVTKDMYTGKETKQTVRKFLRLMPLINSWETRRYTNAIADQLAEHAGLPENSRGATGWSWWEAMNQNKD